MGPAGKVKDRLGMKRMLVASVVVMLVLGVNAAGAADAPAEAAGEDAVMKLGARVFLMCRSCHSTEKDGRHKVGPNLWAIFGSKAGSKEGYNYSEALKGAGFTWDAEKLNEWLAKPREFLPGNKMAFAGVRKEEERDAVIAFLKKETGATE